MHSSFLEVWNCRPVVLSLSFHFTPRQQDVHLPSPRTCFFHLVGFSPTLSDHNRRVRKRAPLQRQSVFPRLPFYLHGSFSFSMVRRSRFFHLFFLWRYSRSRPRCMLHPLFVGLHCPSFFVQLNDLAFQNGMGEVAVPCHWLVSQRAVFWGLTSGDPVPRTVFLVYGVPFPPFQISLLFHNTNFFQHRFSGMTGTR